MILAAVSAEFCTIYIIFGVWIKKVVFPEKPTGDFMSECILALIICKLPPKGEMGGQLADITW